MTEHPIVIKFKSELQKLQDDHLRKMRRIRLVERIMFFVIALFGAACVFGPIIVVLYRHMVKS